LPCQRLKAAPQFWQMKVRLRLDIAESPKKLHTDARSSERTIQEHFLKSR
jgi:hypothetical protein